MGSQKKVVHHAYFCARLEQCWRSKGMSRNIDEYLELLNPPIDEIENDLFDLMTEFESSFVSKVVKENSRVLRPALSLFQQIDLIEL